MNAFSERIYRFFIAMRLFLTHKNVFTVETMYTSSLQKRRKTYKSRSQVCVLTNISEWTVSHK
ncbi:hypothetical protein Bacsa_1616 [Phocaeicola salanitronis DSM 18170]|uniref:Uncharacterized protein n=1 Tax=Phocaeicola salanitronis (strain DSM 18170 / JCM 13657 / CCUG 60908 / BL78) TaxID=667015 RepID=F0R055_PHOSB|nr:hypothetical protein Bacsa_1616 [Phocaeicola salanitronis DSM 18170]